EELRDRRDPRIALVPDGLGERTSRRATDRIALAKLQIVGSSEEEVFGIADLVGSDSRRADADEREILQSEESPGREPALPGHPPAATVVAMPHLAAAIGADLGPGRVPLAAFDDRRIGVERDAPERRVAREHDRVAAPVEESAHGAHRLERP